MPEFRPGGGRIFDALPNGIAASVRARAALLASIPGPEDGARFTVADVQAWTPGQAVRVAFLGGDAALHRAIEAATRQITDTCNLHLDFRDRQSGAYRTWSTDDEEHAAEIRVSFDQEGYWSLVGNDSVNPEIEDEATGSGGNAWQRSMNLEGFADTLPPTWKGDVRHEFMHALGFHHEHQNVHGRCEAELRWEDDPGYEPTTDDDGVFEPDARGRNPGVYTWFAGPPNGWCRSEVDDNLRTLDDPGVVFGPFDPASIMLYRFESFLYLRARSPCAPTGDGESLSDEDRRGLLLLYGVPEGSVAAIALEPAGVPVYGTPARRELLRSRLERARGEAAERENGNDARAQLEAALGPHPDT